MMRRIERTPDDCRQIAAESPHNIEWIDIAPPQSVKHPTHWRCLDCGHEWAAPISNIQRLGTGCGKCRYTRNSAAFRMAPDEWHAAAAGSPHNIEWIEDDAIRSRSPARWRCLDCGHEFRRLIYYIRAGNPCPLCGPVKFRRSKAAIQSDRAAGVKPCSKCRQVKPLAEFHEARGEVDGRTSVCRTCRHVARVPLTPPKNRRCPTCKRVRPLTDYYPKPSGGYGRSGQCKQCDKSRACVRFHNKRAMLYRAAGRVTRAQLEARWDYYGGRCWMCGDIATQFDHVIPLARNGKNFPANLRPACQRCNREKWDKPASHRLHRQID